jgi:hypothetical protein
MGGRPKSKGNAAGRFIGFTPQGRVAYCSRCNRQHPPGLHSVPRWRSTPLDTTLPNEENHGYEAGLSPPESEPKS